MKKLTWLPTFQFPKLLSSTFLSRGESMTHVSPWQIRKMKLYIRAIIMRFGEIFQHLTEGISMV